MKILNDFKIFGILFISSLILQIHLSSGPICAQEVGIDRPGLDYKNFSLPKADPCECEKECIDDPGLNCKAYTYVKPGVQGAQAHCWLKNGIPSPQKNANCVSGVIRQEMCVHGKSGLPQDPDVDAGPFGWGLEYDVEGMGTWIQYSIPTVEGEMTIDGIFISFTSADPMYLWIKAIHIYNGKSVIHKWDDQIYGLSLSSNKTKTQDLFLPLPNPVKVDKGIGISILPEAKSTEGLEKVVNLEIHRVCVSVLNTNCY